MPRHSVLARSILGFSAAGLLISLLMLYIHRQLDTSGGAYVSFCNVNQQVNCDAVLGSRYAYFLGVPIAAWTALTYVGFIVLSVLSSTVAAVALAALSGWSVGYTLVMAAVSIVALRTVCLLCSGLYVVNTVLVALAWALVSNRTGRRTAAVTVVVPLALAVAVGYAATRGEDRPAGLTVADIAAREPTFYKWYLSRPVMPRTADALLSRVHAKGAPDAPVTIVEFSDFFCAHCARAYRDLKRVLARSPNDVRLVFHHFPLDTQCNPTIKQQVHAEACAAAVAAECAGREGKFWEYHDYLFEHGAALGHVAIAAKLGLDVARFRECLGRDQAREAVEQDVNEGTRLGVESTPTLFFNGRTVAGALDGPFYEYAIVIEKARIRHQAAALR
jgi:predicted DsbA family dithiol-disulfide isomerase/uncharacterized membrane protein